MRALLFVTAGVCALALGSSVQGQTLREALARTYSTNPTLAAQRELVEAYEEDIAIARSGSLPQINSRVGSNQDLISSSPTGRNLSATVEVGVPLFDGGRVSNRVRSAQALHRAQRSTLLGVEGDILTEAVEAYVDVLRARAVADLHENQVSVLEETLNATRRIHKAGDLTLTDIAQAEGRLALSRSDLATAKSRLRGAEESYRRIVGTPPGTLEQPQLVQSLPATAEAAERIALDNSPDLAAAVEEVRSAGFLVSSAEAERLPLLSAVAIGRYINLLGTADRRFDPLTPDNQSAGGVGVTASIPIFQGGSVSARVRQAQARQRQWVGRLSAVERQVVARTRVAFAAYQAAQEGIRANETAVSSNEVALEGSAVEFRVGTRTLLDVLNAEQELLNSRVALLSAQRDAHVAAFTLLNAMGLATARELNLDSQTGAPTLANPQIPRAPDTPAVTADLPPIAAVPDQGPAVTRAPEPAVTEEEEAPAEPIQAPPPSAQAEEKGDAPDEPGAAPAAEPRPAPARDARVPSAQAPRAAAPQKPTGSEPLRPGSFVVQLGSFRSAADARTGWQRLKGVLDLSGFTPLIATITIQRGTFHRLSIGGFNSRAEAIRACERIKGQGGACFVRASAGDEPLTGR